jgi:hypothetical protein
MKAWEEVTLSRDASLSFHSNKERDRDSLKAPIVWAKHLDHSTRHALLVSKNQYLILDNVSYKDGRPLPRNQSD